MRPLREVCSVRIARGLYYRTGAFKGERVQSTETVYADTGLLGATTEHLYFAGPNKGFRIRYDRIVAFEPYSDGIGVQRDAASARPQRFMTGDGWFAYNLVVNLARCSPDFSRRPHAYGRRPMVGSNRREPSSRVERPAIRART